MTNHNKALLTENAFIGAEVRSVKGAILMAGSKNKGSSEPVMVKDLALRADEG